MTSFRHKVRFPHQFKGRFTLHEAQQQIMTTWWTGLPPHHVNMKKMVPEKYSAIKNYGQVDRRGQWIHAGGRTEGYLSEMFSHTLKSRSLFHMRMWWIIYPTTNFSLRGLSIKNSLLEKLSMLTFCTAIFIDFRVPVLPRTFRLLWRLRRRLCRSIPKLG